MNTVYANAKDAKSAGSKTYFTGIACKNGHVAERYTSNRECVECDRLRKEARKAAKKPVKVPAPVEAVVVIEPKKTVRVVVFTAPVRNRKGNIIRNRTEIASDYMKEIRA